jgi:hypothetical protein
MFLLMHKCPQSLNKLFNNAVRTSEVILAFEECYKDIRCQVCEVLSRTILKIPKKMKSVGFGSGALLCHDHNMSTTMNTFFFARKPEIFYIMLIAVV